MKMLSLTGTKVIGGLTFREARLLMETVYNTGKSNLSIYNQKHEHVKNNR
jgi:arginase family enzyme